MWPADFNLLTCLPGLEQVDVITTDAVLAAGFHERLVDLLPGITEERIDAADDRQPMLVVPAAEDGRDHFTWRDREDELLAVIRALKGSGLTARRTLPPGR